MHYQFNNSGTCISKLPHPVNKYVNEEECKTHDARAVAEIKDGQYTKFIASRAIDLDQRVDIPGTLLCGRRSNTFTIFALSHPGFEACGFSTKLVVSVRDGK